MAVTQWLRYEVVVTNGFGYTVPVLVVPYVLVSLGRPVSGGRARRLTARIYCAFYDKCVGHVCRSVFGHIYSQLGGVHDNSVVGLIPQIVQPRQLVNWETKYFLHSFSEEFHEFAGLDDVRLSHPYSHKPSYRFGTIPFSHTDSTIAKYFKDMHHYMRTYDFEANFWMIKYSLLYLCVVLTNRA